MKGHHPCSVGPQSGSNFLAGFLLVPINFDRKVFTLLLGWKLSVFGSHVPGFLVWYQGVGVHGLRLSLRRGARLLHQRAGPYHSGE